MLYMKIFDDYEAEILERKGIGKVVYPYNALMEEYIDCALDSLEESYNLTKEEREEITPELYNISHDIGIDEEYGLTEAYEMAEDALNNLRGER